MESLEEILEKFHEVSTEDFLEKFLHKIPAEISGVILGKLN